MKKYYFVVVLMVIAILALPVSDVLAWGYGYRVWETSWWTGCFPSICGAEATTHTIMILKTGEEPLYVSDQYDYGLWERDHDPERGIENVMWVSVFEGEVSWVKIYQDVDLRGKTVFRYIIFGPVTRPGYRQVLQRGEVEFIVE